MNWLYKDSEMSEIIFSNKEIDDEFKRIEKIKHSLLKHLKGNKIWNNFNTKTIEKANSIFSFDAGLGELYDFADENKIWIEPYFGE